MLTPYKVKHILESNTLSGFSVAVKGGLKRYIVATTHNETMSIGEIEYNKLSEQANENMYKFDNVTIGGWENSRTGKIYIDAGMSTDDKDYALNVASYHNQIAIWDGLEEKEIRL